MTIEKRSVGDLSNPRIDGGDSAIKSAYDPL